MNHKLFPLLLSLLILAGCHRIPAEIGPPSLTPIPSASPSPAPSITPFPTEPACLPKPVVVPTLPAEIPVYTALDPSTGLHVTGSYQLIELETYRLSVTGKVDHPLSLSYDELRCLPRAETDAELYCPGFFTDQATWAGTPIKNVLELAGIQEDAQEVYLRSADGYEVNVTPAEALKPKNLLVYEWNGEPLPILHGFPVRAAFPGLQGSLWVKWLVEILIK